MDKQTQNDLLLLCKNNNKEALIIGLTSLGLIEEKPKSFAKKFIKLSKSLFNKKEFGWYHADFMTNLLNTAIENNHIELAKYLIESADILVKPNLHENSLWRVCLQKSDLETIKYLLEFPLEDYKAKVQSLTYSLIFIDNVNIDILKYIFEDSSQLRYSYGKEMFMKFINDEEDNHTKEFSFFANLCAKGNKEGVDFFLDHPDLKSLINLSTFNKSLFFSCYKSQVTMMDYLLNDEKMPFKEGEHYDTKRLIPISARFDLLEMAQYLIFEHGVAKTHPNLLLDISKAETILKFNGRHAIESYEETVKKIYEMFEQRELMQSLEKDLTINEKPKSRMKI